MSAAEDQPLTDPADLATFADAPDFFTAELVDGDELGGRWAVYDTVLLRFCSPVTEARNAPAEWADEDPDRFEVRRV